MAKQIIVIAHNVRSTHNIGSMFRLADGLAIDKVYLTGYSPHPFSDDDNRLPHLAKKIDKQINKTALGATQSVPWEAHENIMALIEELKRQDWTICSLEQTPQAQELNSFRPPKKVAIIVGSEIGGLPAEVIKACNASVEIPMFGVKESFNVSTALAMALYHIRFGIICSSKHEKIKNIKR
jgi:23S rRNA (guanosine2251-2'-O)-methyltransferase